jgi:hypothetical protein
LPSIIVSDVINIIEKYLHEKLFDNAYACCREIFYDMNEEYLKKKGIASDLVQRYVELFGYDFGNYIKEYKEENKTLCGSKKFNDDMRELFFMFNIPADDGLIIYYKAYNTILELSWIHQKDGVPDPIFNFFLECSDYKGEHDKISIL